MTTTNALTHYLTTTAAAIVLLAGSFATAADETLTISNGHSFATPPGARAAGGYVIVQNNGDTADRLIGGRAGFAEVTEIHEMKMEGDVMKMRELPNGIEIPAGASVELKRGGLHVMFMQLTTGFNVGDELPVTLIFENAGEIQTTLSVLPIGQTSHKGMHMKQKPKTIGEDMHKSMEHAPEKLDQN